MPVHSALTGSELHENKGAASASDNTVASATSGATVWRKVNSSMIDTSSIFDTNKQVFQAVLTDVSNASAVYIPIPFDCSVSSVRAVLGFAINTADATVTCRNNGGTSMGTLLITYSGSAAGSSFSLSPASNNTFSAGDKMLIETDGASSTGAGDPALYITILVTVTG